MTDYPNINLALKEGYILTARAKKVYILNIKTVDAKIIISSGMGSSFIGALSNLETNLGSFAGALKARIQRRGTE